MNANYAQAARHAKQGVQVIKLSHWQGDMTLQAYRKWLADICRKQYRYSVKCWLESLQR